MKYYLGIDLGGTNIAVGLTDDVGQIIFKHSEKTNAKGKSFEQLVRRIAEVAKKTVSCAGFELKEISAVGMGTPSCVNSKTGLLVNANNLGWQNVPLYDEMKKHFECPVYIQNDAACAAFGEKLCGAAAEYENVIMVTLGTGVGGGIILKGRIWNGCDGMGAEIGHTKIVYEGKRCTCGQRGCFECYASATALIRQTKIAALDNPESIINKLCENEENITAKTPFDAAKLGDKTAVGVIEQYISYLSAGLSSLIATFRPQAVIIGGGVSCQSQYLIEPLRKQLEKDVFSAQQIGIPYITTAKLGNDAGIIGAAMLCTQ